MAYSYQISYNGTDYSAIEFGHEVEMDGNWIEGTKIWRENIGELKFTKTLNGSDYTQLATWFEDPTKFETRIYVKVLKDSVQESIHWFGIKWGELDKDLKVYTVEPIAYDLWAQYFEYVRDLDVILAGTTTSYYYYDTTTNYPYLGGAGITGARTFVNQLKVLVAAISSFDTDDIVSSLLAGDDFEDSSTVDEQYGVKKNYVTNDQSRLINAGGYFKNRMSLKGYLDTLKLLQVYAYFDINDKLRLEHTRYFVNGAIAEAVDFSAYIKEYDEKFNYEIVEIPTVDRVKMKEVEDHDDMDFIGYEAVYSPISNRPDAQKREFASELFSDLQYYNANSEPVTDLIFASTENKAYKWSNIDFSSFSATKNRLTLDNGLTPGNCGSQNFRAFSGTGLDITVFTYSFTVQAQFMIKDRSSGSTISNVLTVNSTGETTGTLTPTSSANDAYLHITSPQVSCYVVLEEQDLARRDVPNDEGFATETVKTNGALSVANIFNDLWTYNGLSMSCTYNGDAFSFDATEYNLRREDVKFHYSTLINPYYGFNDGTRIGMIQKWKRNLETGFYEISITYQEDE